MKSIFHDKLVNCSNMNANNVNTNARAGKPNSVSQHNNIQSIQREITELKINTRLIKNWIACIAVCIILLISFVLINKIITKTYNRLNMTFDTSVHYNDLHRGIKPIDKSPLQDIDIKKSIYYALLIGNNEYTYWSKLEYPITDIENMEESLIANYTFEKDHIKSIKNGSYEEIYKAFESYKEHGLNTFLLIYYAGHGKFDPVAQKASLIPVDAEKNSDSKNITSDMIRDLLKKSGIQNILFISDACYLGAMASRGLDNDTIETINFRSFNSFAHKQSRKFISSGAKEIVPDKSYFNEYLIKYLNNNPHEILFDYTLYNDIIEPVQNNSLITPVYGVFFDTNDEGGHFYFVKKNIHYLLP